MSERTLGNYKLVAEIGRGPHGRVFRGVHTQTQRPAALKVFGRQSVDAHALEPFRKYSQALGRLRHPGIARFFEAIESEGRLCLAWELVEAGSLAQALKSGPLEPKRSWEILRQVLEALAYAHPQGAVHRNLTPSNILLAEGDRVVITDFGTAILHADRTAAAEYHSPEHFTEAKLTAQADIYQVGVLAYQLLTGKLPFTGTHDVLAHRIAQERPSDPSSYNNRLAWQLDWVVQKALSKEPQDRFNTVVEFGEGLRLGLQDSVARQLEPVLTPEAQAARRGAAPAAVPSRPASPQPAKPASARPAASGEPPAAAAAAVASPEETFEIAVDMPSVAPPPVSAKAPAAKPASAPPAAARGKTAAAATPSALAQNARALSARNAAAPAAPKEPAAQPSARSARPRVLFVDDDERILNALEGLFRETYEVRKAQGGAAALAMLAEGGIHVVVSDQRMPQMTGVELLREARRVAPRTTRVLLTGYTDLASLVGSINQGEIFRFVMKPWNNDELRKVIAEAVEAGAALPPAAGVKSAAPRSAGSLLVIDRDEGMARGLQRLLAGASRVVRVDNAAEAAKVLSREEIAAVVADMNAGMSGLVPLFRELRAKRPGVMSILLTDEPDSDLAIELVNRAHIFRFLPKPVSARDLRTQVADALRRYSLFKQRAAAAAAPAPATKAPA